MICLTKNSVHMHTNFISLCMVILGSAKDSLKLLAEKKMEFDFIFIDVDKSGYSLYYKVFNF